MSQLCGSGLRSRSNVTSAAWRLDEPTASAAQLKTNAIPVDFAKRQTQRIADAEAVAKLVKNAAKAAE